MLGRDIYKQVARLHTANIDQGFLSSLGLPFLSLLYEAIDADESSVLLVAEREGRVVGFVSGAEGMGRIYRQLLRRSLRLSWTLMPTLFAPHKLWRVAEILFLSRRSNPMSAFAHAELLSIAVDPAHRGAGLAQDLYRQLTEHFRRRHVDAFRIVVGEQLSAAHCFYLKRGARPVGAVRIHAGERSVVYEHELSRSDFGAL